MKTPGNPANPVEERLEEAILASEALTRAPATYEVATSPVASPIRRAVEHDCARVCVDGTEYFLSRRTEDAADFVDLPGSAHAARQAAAAGVAPAVIEELAGVDSVVYDHLPDGVRWARNDDLAQVDVLARVIAAKKLLHKGPSMGRRRSVFGEIESFAQLAARDLPPHMVPRSTLWLRDCAAQCDAALQASGVEIVPAHGDGVSSNVMVSDDGSQVWLVDYDVAADMDPFLDFGSLLVESCRSDADWRTGVELALGTADEAGHARCRLYGFGDDLRWGLWGVVMGHLSGRPGIEFYKYGQWRLLRAHYTASDRRFESWLRGA